MTMIKKVYNHSLFTTSIFVFGVWHLIEKINLDIIKSEVVQFIIITFINFILAYGFFHACANIIIIFANKAKWLKRWIYGSSYIEGVWVGYTLDFSNNDYEIRYTITKIEQTLENIVYSATSHREDGKVRTFADSKTAWIDTTRSILFLFFEGNRIDQEVAKSYVELRLRKRVHSTIPEYMEGTLTYLKDGNICQHFEKKVSDLPYAADWTLLLEKAKVFYAEENIRSFMP